MAKLRASKGQRQILEKMHTGWELHRVKTEKGTYNYFLQNDEDEVDQSVHHKTFEGLKNGGFVKPQGKAVDGVTVFVLLKNIAAALEKEAAE
jgi:hypothetical protein